MSEFEYTGMTLDDITNKYAGVTRAFKQSLERVVSAAMEQYIADPRNKRTAYTVELADAYVTMEPKIAPDDNYALCWCYVFSEESGLPPYRVTSDWSGDFVRFIRDAADTATQYLDIPGETDAATALGIIAARISAKRPLVTVTVDGLGALVSVSFRLSHEAETARRRAMRLADAVPVDADAETLAKAVERDNERAEAEAAERDRAWAETPRTDALSAAEHQAGTDAPEDEPERRICAYPGCGTDITDMRGAPMVCRDQTHRNWWKRYGRNGAVDA